MAKICIITGPRGKGRFTEALPFLPGLYVHKPPGVSGGEVYTITHIESGLAIIADVVENELEVVRMVFGKAFWEVPVEIIYKKDTYYGCVKEALRVTLNHTKSEKQEKHIADDLDGKRQPASGSRWGYRRDVITPKFLIEAKTTAKTKFSVSVKDLEFLRVQAYTQGKVPALIVQLQDREEIVLIPTQEFSEEELSALVMNPTLSKIKNKRTFTIGIEEAGKVSHGKTTPVETAIGAYLLLGYEDFLSFAKRGV